MIARQIRPDPGGVMANRAARKGNCKGDGKGDGKGDRR
jgi:hypothetical protein